VSEPTPPAPSPAASAATAPVVVRGLESTCGQCREPTTCVVAVHDAGAERSEDWVWFEDKHALAFARELLLRVGQAPLRRDHQGPGQQDCRWCLPVQRVRALRRDPR
jgi:hypothetical protein